MITRDTWAKIISISLCITGILIASAGILVGLTLLIFEKLEGAHFVTLTLGLLVIAILLPFLPNISEFSIAGNIVKFRQVKEEADVLLQELRESRVSTYRTLLRLASVFPGGLPGGRATKDPRIDNFWELFQAIEASGLKSVLFKELLETVNEIRQGQFGVVRNFAPLKNENRPTDSVSNFDELRSCALQSFEETKTAKTDEEKQENREKLLEALDEYQKLDNLVAACVLAT